MNQWGVVFFLLFCFPLINNVKAQNISNEGVDFWAVFPSHDPSRNDLGNAQLANITIYVTSKLNSRARISYGDFIGDYFNIAANQVRIFNIPRDRVYISYSERNRNLPGRGIHIEVEPGYPKVVVYSHIYAGARSAASLILPQESLGQKYYSMNYTQSYNEDNDNRNYLTLVASEPNTNLLIHTKSGGTIPVNLINIGDVYQYMPEGLEDLTGTYVEIDPNSPDNCTKRFAAFSGSTSVTVGCDVTRDPLYQQLYPVTSWGKSYCIIPFKNRYYYYRVLAEEDDTRIMVNNVFVTSLRRGEVYPRNDIQPAQSDPILITADKRISVAQYALTQECSGVSGRVLSDPEMVLLNPIEFNIKHVTLFSSNAQNIREKYINVSIKTSARNTFRLNGEQLPESSWQILASSPDLSYSQISISSQNSTLIANEGFNAIAYGFGDHESYAYSAGTNLAANNYLLVSNSVTGFDSPNACIDQESDFKIVLAFKSLNHKVTWQLDSEEAVDITTPPREFHSDNGDLLFEYVYNIRRKFPVTGAHTMSVTATMPNVGSCIGRPLQYDFTFNAYPIPVASFESPDQVCFDDDVIFTDRSESNISDQEINKWLWDFGDGEMSTEQNPTHVYSASGDFTIRLSAGLEDGCLSDPVIRIITVRPKIVADFIVKPIDCITSEVVATDISSVENNTEAITSWVWDFGDGSPKILNQIAKHRYSAPGNYEITLIVGTGNGCLSKLKIIPVNMKGLPIVAFSSQKVCVSDVTTQFTNNSTDADGNIQSLSYLWDFGDVGSSLNSSTDRNASHKYSVAGNYTVKLIVATADGCSEETSRELNVNGSQITAGFVIDDVSNLCSGNKVVVTDNSFVDKGRTTKIEWIIDSNKPNEIIVDEDPERGKIYEFPYPPATSPVPRIVTIVMRVYSGITCSEESRQTITIYPTPKVVFNAIPPLCLNSGPIRIDQASEVTGISGSSIYSGNGLSEDGIFDPMVAGVGTHTLSYTFRTDVGCEAVKTQTIVVFPAPVSLFTRDIFAYAGEQKQFDLVSTGVGLTFQWEPSINLDKDNIQNPLVMADQDRTYSVTIHSSQGCSVTEKIHVHIIPEIETSNAFSPNGDGKNDVWVLKNIETYLNA
ncbi:MAG TPA: PKD domain-containing protein, partial [Pedobacter sp.]|nr:PKD domain-containing protein [Pedobacter sp.]